MVVSEAHFIGIAILPPEHDSPLIIYPDAEHPVKVAVQA
jgi:hypothetical protein